MTETKERVIGADVHYGTFRTLGNVWLEPAEWAKADI
jgi:hypothetical protein